MPRGVKMDPMHKAVADAYLADPAMNKTKAYMSVFKDCAEDSARSASARLFATNSMDAYVQAKLQKRTEKVEVTQEWVVRELAKLAGFDPRKLFDDDGSVKLVRDWDDDTAACVSEIHVNEIFGGSGDQKQAIGLAKKISTRDKTKALELLGKHLGMFRDRVSVENPDGTALAPAVINILPVTTEQIVKANAVAAPGQA